MLYERTNDIQVNYLDVTSYGMDDTLAGIENADGTIGLQYLKMSTAGNYRNFYVRYYNVNQPVPPASATSPTVTTVGATSVTSTSAILNGAVNPNGSDTTYYFQYGISTSYGSTTKITSAGSGAIGVSISAAIANLTPDAVYHYRLVATNSYGTSYGNDQTFTASSSQPSSGAPTVTTAGATSVTSTSAILNGTVNPNGSDTTYYFQYGSGPLVWIFGFTTERISVGSGTSDVLVSAAISNLTPDAVYRYRLVATNSAGTSHGDEQTFTASLLPSVPPTVTTGGATSVTSSSATLNGTVNPNGAYTTCYFQYGTSASYGSTITNASAGSGASDVSVSADIAELTPGATYHYRLVATNSGGTSYGDDRTFTASLPASSLRSLYFPHIVSDGVWETEICIINAYQIMSGSFKAYDNEGNHVSEDIAVTLDPHGRREITVGDEFTDPGDICYIVFESDSDAVVGYTKFYIEGQYRVAVPAVLDSEINTGDIYISHIASGGSAQPWYTGVSLLNTTPSDKTLTIEFDNDETKTVELLANEHKAFTIRSLFDGQPQPDIHSAVVRDASGVIGLELFTNNSRKQMSGILLKDDTTTSIYYPHTASENGWSTGIVAYNPSDTPCDMTITPYTAAGDALTTPTSKTIAGKEKYIGVVSALDLSVDTAWLKIEATSPITGFELFAKANQLGGYTGVGISGTEGVFAKLESDGATGIAFVNIENSSATVILTAYNDTGDMIATKTIDLNAHEKVVNTAEGIFAGYAISNATYITYSSDKEIVGFQLNISSDGMMLDGLPGM